MPTASMSSVKLVMLMVSVAGAEGVVPVITDKGLKIVDGREADRDSLQGLPGGFGSGRVRTLTGDAIHDRIRIGHLGHRLALKGE
jgi:hypothetical protein